MGPSFFVVYFLFPFLVMRKFKILLLLSNCSHVAISIKGLLKPVHGVALMVNKKCIFFPGEHVSKMKFTCIAEFNRISVEVLSVVAVQVKSVQDAIRDKKDIFNFMGEMIKCVPTVGIFITMNPGSFDACKQNAIFVHFQPHPFHFYRIRWAHRAS